MASATGRWRISAIHSKTSPGRSAHRVGVAPGARWLLVPPLLLTLLVYAPILGNYFHDDDFLNLYRIANLRLTEYLITPHAGHLLVLRNALFALSYAVFGTAAAPYFATVLLSHCLNVALLFRLIHRLADSPTVACFGAALWGASPLHQDVLGWYSVYGHVLAGTALLIFLNALVSSHAQNLTWRALTASILSLLGGAISFGTGIATCIVSPWVAWLLLPSGPGRRRAVSAFAILAALTPVLYVGLLQLHATWYHGTAAPVLPEVNARQLALIARMIARFLYLGIVHLVTTPVRLAPALPSWFCDLLVLLFATALAIVLIKAPPQFRRMLFGLLLTSVAGYGIVAAGRFTLLPYPRHHYAPLAPLAAVTAVVVQHIAPVIRWPSRLKGAPLVAWLIGTGALFMRFGPIIQHQDIGRSQTLQAVAMMRATMASHRIGDQVAIPNQSLPAAVNPTFIPRRLFPGWAGVFIIFFRDNVVDGKRVVFLEADPAVIEAASGGRRSANLFEAVRPAEPQLPSQK